MVSKGDLVKFKPGINGIEEPENYGIFVEKFRKKKSKTQMVKVYTIKGMQEMKQNNMDSKSLGKSIQLRGDALPEMKDMKKRLVTWINEIKDQSERINQTETKVGILSEKKLWEKMLTHGLMEADFDTIAKLWYELDLDDLTKEKRKELKRLLESNRSRGHGYFDVKGNVWTIISEKTRKQVLDAISLLGNLKNRMFHMIEVPIEEDSEEMHVIRAPKPWEEIEFKDEDKEVLQFMYEKMAYFVEHDSWGENGLGGTYIHTLDDFSLHTFLSYLAEDYVNEGKTSYSDAFVKFLITAGYWNDTEALIAISKRRVLLEKDFDWETSERIEAIAAEYKEPMDTPGAFEDRTDFREVEAYTIDPPTAKDFDDAVSLTREGNNYILYVHIADVAFYVEKDSSLDLHARRRATSVYLPTRVLPMLPHHLSDNLCSLREQVPRLAMTVEIHYDSQGNKLLDKCKVHNSVINVTKNLSYDVVNEAIDKGESPFIDLHTFALLLQQHRKGLKIMTDDVRLELGGEMSLSTKTASNSTQMIETFMVAANETVAEIIQQKKLPVVYRNHPLPDKEDVKRFNVHAKVIGLDCEIDYPDLFEKKKEEDKPSLLDMMTKGGGNISFSLGPGSNMAAFSPKEEEEEEDVDLGKIHQDGLAQLSEEKREAILKPFRQVLARVEKIEDDYDRKLAYLIVLRTLSRANYLPGNIGHFGLGSVAYLHFTSPIRRYPDIIAHRVCKAMLAEEEMAYTADEIEDIAIHCSEQSEIAEKLERIIVGAGFSFLTRNPGYSENTQGIVTSVSGGGVFVTLPNGIEARIPLNQMTDGATFVDDYESMAFLGSKGKFNLEEEITPENWRELLQVDEDNPMQILAKLGDKMAIRFIGWDLIEGRVTAAPVKIEEREI
ncbi:MAG: VacB/RNase II family 3'-5' exoribonuclease [Candidatus Heimdallarchaeota archaeon]|nr:VacB/RNase II family 3'-5' exoribonuclease [Candidatus Heimdallarchaeota archaeon]